MTFMRRFLRTRFVLTLVAVLLASGIAAAFAQNATTEPTEAHYNNWAGIRTGYPLGLTVHYGRVNGFGAGADMRISGRVEVHGSVARFGLGVDVLHTVYSDSPFTVYLGAGPAIETGSDGTWLDLHGLVGSEFRFVNVGAPQVGLFAEGTLGGVIGFSGNQTSQIPAVGLALGVNYHF